MNKDDLMDKAKKILSVLKKAGRKALDALSSAKRRTADIVVAAGIVLLCGIIIAPSVYFCVVNHSKNVCLEHMYEMSWELLDRLEKEAETNNKYLHNLIIDGNYEKLLSRINKLTGESRKYPDSDYRITLIGDELTVLCRKHEDLNGVGISLSSIDSLSGWNNLPEKYENILYITVTGPNKYYQNDALDLSDAGKMVFSGYDMNSVLNNLTVTAVYEGGEKKALERDRYVITSEPIDMTQSGKKTVTVRTRSRSVWKDSAYANFSFNVLGSEDIPPLIVDAGENGKFELAAWDWKDFVEESSQQKDGETFGASIIRYNGEYYYYPDGLRIVNGSQNTTPFEFALDTDSDKPAYSVKFDTSSVILKSSDGDKIHNGSLRAENGNVYIWQDNPSKELPKGWIRVYCEVKKY